MNWLLDEALTALTYMTTFKKNISESKGTNLLKLTQKTHFFWWHETLPLQYFISHQCYIGSWTTKIELLKVILNPQIKVILPLLALSQNTSNFSLCIIPLTCCFLHGSSWSSWNFNQHLINFFLKPKKVSHIYTTVNIKGLISWHTLNRTTRSSSDTLHIL